MPTPVFFAQPDHVQPLPAWMRAALWLTSVLNVLGAVAFFLPGLTIGRQLMGLPTAHPVYLWIIAEFICIIGLAYGYCALTNRAPVVFIAMGAVGKLTFSLTLAAFWLLGDLPGQTPLFGSADFIFGCLFIAYLTRPYTGQSKKINRN